MESPSIQVMADLPQRPALRIQTPSSLTPAGRFTFLSVRVSVKDLRMGPSQLLPEPGGRIFRETVDWRRRRGSLRLVCSSIAAGAYMSPIPTTIASGRYQQTELFEQSQETARRGFLEMGGWRRTLP